MGMTNEQFEVLQTRTLRVLEKAQKEIAEAGAKSETLDELIEDMKSELKKP